MVNAIRNRTTAASSRRDARPSTPLSETSIPQESLSRSEQNSTSPHTPNSSSDSAANGKKNVRGPTRGIALRKFNKQNKQKLIVHMDPDLRRPVDSVESAKLSSELGILSREYMSIPTSWKNLSDTELMMAMDKLDMHLSIDNPDADKIEDVMDLLKHRVRHQRHRLNKHFKKFSSLEEAIENKPSFGGLSQDNWEELCTTLFSDPKYQERCRKNQENRSKMKTNHNQGSRSFVVAHHMLCQQSETDVDEVDRIQFYKHCHYTEGKGWINSECEQKHVEMERRRVDAETFGEEVDVDEIADDVLGKRSSYVVGLGYGPKPKKVASNLTTKKLETALREKDEALKEIEEALKEKEREVNTMKSTLEQHGRLLQQLLESQRNPNISP